MSTVGERLKQARLQAGYGTAADAARALDEHRQNVRDHEADRRGVSPEMAARYARRYGVSRDWILFGGPDMKRAAGEGSVPIVGFVGADAEGRVIFAQGQRSYDEAPVPPGGSANAVALEVRGTSQGELAPDGSLIYFEDQRTQPTPDMLNHFVVAELDTGEVLVKRLLRGSAPGLYDLWSISAETRRDVTIVWAAHITAIIPPRQAQRIIRRTAA
jgi:hypothetical protein